MISRPPTIRIKQSMRMLSSNMLLLNLIPLIDVTFSTPTGDYTNNLLAESPGQVVGEMAIYANHRIRLRKLARRVRLLSFIIWGWNIAAASCTNTCPSTASRRDFVDGAVVVPAPLHRRAIQVPCCIQYNAAPGRQPSSLSGLRSKL